MVKGFLRSTEGVFQLSPSITVIGRENSDYIIQVRFLFLFCFCFFVVFFWLATISTKLQIEI